MPISDNEIRELLAMHERNRRLYRRIIRVQEWLWSLLRRHYGTV